MHSLKDLQDYFNWSYMQTRKRVKLLKDDFKEEVKGGGNQKYLVTDNGLTLLERLKELEEQGNNLKSCLKQIKEETENHQSNGNEEGVKQPKVELKYAKEYINRLESENNYLRKKLDEKDNHIQQLLPSAKENGDKDEFEEMGFFQLVKKWLTTKT